MYILSENYNDIKAENDFIFVLDSKDNSIVLANKFELKESIDKGVLSYSDFVNADFNIKDFLKRDIEYTIDSGYYTKYEIQDSEYLECADESYRTTISKHFMDNNTFEIILDIMLDITYLKLYHSYKNKDITKDLFNSKLLFHICMDFERRYNVDLSQYINNDNLIEVSEVVVGHYSVTFLLKFRHNSKLLVESYIPNAITLEQKADKENLKMCYILNTKTFYMQIKNISYRCGLFIDKQFNFIINKMDIDKLIGDVKFWVASKGLLVGNYFIDIFYKGSGIYNCFYLEGTDKSRVLNEYMAKDGNIEDVVFDIYKENIRLDKTLELKRHNITKLMRG